MIQKEKHFVSAGTFQYEVAKTHFCVNKLSNCLALALENSCHLAVNMVEAGWGNSQEVHHWDFPCGTVVKNPPADAGDMGSIPGLGRSHMPRSN